MVMICPHREDFACPVLFVYAGSVHDIKVSSRTKNIKYMRLIQLLVEARGMSHVQIVLVVTRIFDQILPTLFYNGGGSSRMCTCKFCHARKFMHRIILITKLMNHRYPVTCLTAFLSLFELLSQIQPTKIKGGRTYIAAPRGKYLERISCRWYMRLKMTFSWELH